MATYTKVSKSIPSQQRTAIITAVAAGDKIDLEDVLGRPARKVIFNMTDASDAVQYKVNHLRKLRTQRTSEQAYSVTDQVYGVFESETIEFWGNDASTFSGTGSETLETIDGLRVASIEIVSLTLADPSGSVITLSVS